MAKFRALVTRPCNLPQQGPVKRSIPTRLDEEDNDQ